MAVHLQLQTERAECGLACLAMVASAHGLQIGLAELRQRFSISLKGINLVHLIRHAQALGMAARPLRLDIDDLRELQLPCILHWDLNHFVVLTKVSRDTVTVFDPAAGKRTLALGVVSEHFTGVALELTPTSQFKRADERRKVQLSNLVGRIYGLRRALVNIFVIAASLEAATLIMPMVTQWVVDGALVSGDRDLLLLTLLGGGMLITIQFLLSMARGWVSVRMNQQISTQFATNLFAHLLSLPLSFFEKRHIGDISSRFQSLAEIRSALTEGSVSAAIDGVMAILTLSMLFLYSPRLCVFVLGALALYGLLRWTTFKALRGVNEERIIAAAKEQSYFLETIRAVQPLKIFGRMSERLARWQNLMVDVQNRDVVTDNLDLWFRSGNKLIFGLESMLILYFGGTAVLDHGMTLGMLLAFIAYKLQFEARATSLIDLLVRLKMLGLHAERLADIALEPPEETGSIETDLTRIQPRIEVRNVSFRYGDGEPWILRDFSLTIEPGEHVAISGPSGCGKSTLLKLVLGFLQPNEGDIRIGGVTLRQLGPSQYRSLIGAVMQDDSLLAGSIAENIACFDPRMDLDRVRSVAKLAQIDSEIVEMPMGFQTLVGDMGNALSGGQRQRILLARALYAQPKILALDEATSSLDPESEIRVNDAVRTLTLTRLTIAHRAETLNSAQRVVSLVSASGTGAR